MTASPPSLDSKKDNCNSTCGRVVVEGTVAEGEETRKCAVRMRCKRWRCLACGPRMARELSRAIGIQAKAHGLDRLLTLTLDPSKLEPGQDPYTVIRKVWAKFRVYLRRKTGERVKFIQVIEQHK